MDYEALRCALDALIFDWMLSHGLNATWSNDDAIGKAENALLDALENAVSDLDGPPTA